MGSGHGFVVLGAHHKVVDSNQWSPLQYIVYMDIKDVCDGKSETIYYANVKIGFVLILTS